jgi:MSHA biogenesis protein MshP
MHHKKNRIFPRQQHGSMLVMALFVIVVLAYLGLTISRLLASGTDAVVHEVLGQRALNAARAGIECQLATTFATTPCANLPQFTFNNVQGLENCTYQASVSQKNVIDGSLTRTYAQFTSTGQCAVGNIVVSRTVYIDAML